MPGYWLPLWFCAALLFSAPTVAANIDPPGRVGRISMASEGTHLRVGDSIASGVSLLNWPLTTGALIDTAPDARAEARIGPSSIRLDGGSSLELAELGDERIWLRLPRGSVILGIFSPEHAAEMVLDTPQGRMRFDSPGVFRVDVSGGTSAFSSYSGTARIEDSALSVRPGERILILGGADRSYVLGHAAIDSFRQWSLAREQLDAGGGKHYVSPEMTGYEELDRHGIWRESPEYGMVWYPQGLPGSWSPYRWGRWVWISPWGWTWIDESPWGFAPFHYGRWAHIGGNWAWIPGTYVARPVYAPALVVWLGRPGWGGPLSSAPAVGWLPLGPKEAYYPHYRSSLRHIRNINVGHAHNAERITASSPSYRADITDAHRNRSITATIIPRQTKLSGGIAAQTATVVHEKLDAASTTIASAPPQIHKTSENGDHRPADPAFSGKTFQPMQEEPSGAARMQTHRSWRDKPPPAVRAVSAVSQPRTDTKERLGDRPFHPRMAIPSIPSPPSPEMPSTRGAGRMLMTKPSNAEDHGPPPVAHADSPRRMRMQEKSAQTAPRENPRMRQNRMNP